MFIRGSTSSSGGYGPGTQTRPNIPKFLFKVKKGDQVQYNPPLRHLSSSSTSSSSYQPRTDEVQQPRKTRNSNILKKWSMRRHDSIREGVEEEGVVVRRPKVISRSTSKRWSLKRKSTKSSEWEAQEELTEVADQEQRRSVTKCSSLKVKKSSYWDADEEANVPSSSTGKPHPLNLKILKSRSPAWRLSLQDTITGSNSSSTALYLQDTNSPTSKTTPAQELRTLKRTLSDAKFYQGDSALAFLFPEPEPVSKQTLGTLIRRVSSKKKKKKLEKQESKMLKEWRDRYVGVNKKFVMKHLVSLCSFESHVHKYNQFDTM